MGNYPIIVERADDGISFKGRFSEQLEAMIRADERAKTRKKAFLEAAAMAKADLRCATTGNPFGTDTWRIGHKCPCPNCQHWPRLRAKAEE